MGNCPLCARPVQRDLSCDCDEYLFEAAVKSAKEFLTLEDVIASYEENNKSRPGMGANFGDGDEVGYETDGAVQLLSLDGVDT